MLCSNPCVFPVRLTFMISVLTSQGLEEHLAPRRCEFFLMTDLLPYCAFPMFSTRGICVDSGDMDGPKDSWVAEGLMQSHRPWPWAPSQVQPPSAFSKAYIVWWLIDHLLSMTNLTVSTHYFNVYFMVEEAKTQTGRTDFPKPLM